MLLVFTTEDIASFPKTHREFLMKELAKRVGSPAAEPEPEPAKETAKKEEPAKKETPKEEPAKEAAPAIDRKEVLDTARKFAQKSGAEALKGILQQMEIPNVKACPDDRLAELLAHLAVEE